jgi:GT2 family glycosyltransferase
MNQDLPPISIVIPVFNQWTFTEACLQALARTIPPGGTEQRHQIIIVDNGSTDQTETQLRSVAGGLWQNARLTYVRLPENRGFNEASNLGAERSDNDLLVFLNNDTVPQTGWLDGLWHTLRLRDVGIVGPKLLFPDTLTINHIGYSFNEQLGGFFPIYFDRPATFPPACKPREVQAVLGACMMIRKADFFRLGHFSLEGLEDIDLCLKAREAGLRVIFTPRAEVWHHGGATFRNTAEALIPKMTNDAFNQRWPSSKLERDDERFYREDGYTFTIHSNRSVELISRHDEARKQLALAVSAREKSDLTAAIALAEEARAIYPRNVATLRQLAGWLKESGQTERANEIQQELDFLAGMR